MDTRLPPGMLLSLRRIEQAPGGRAELGHNESAPLNAEGLVHRRERCGCCRAIYELSRRGRDLLARLTADERA